MIRLRISLALLLVVALAGCTSTSSDELFGLNPNLPESNEQVAKTGDFPKIGVIPEGETDQLTAEETADTKVKLQQAAQKGRAQQQQDATTQYQREVDALQQMAQDQQKRRLQEIEGTTQPVSE